MSTPADTKVLPSSSSQSSKPNSQTDDIDLDMTVTEVVNNEISETDVKKIEGEKDASVKVKEPVLSQSGEEDPNQDDSHDKRPVLKIKLAVRRKVGSSEKVAVVPAKGKAGRPKKSSSATKKRAAPSSASRPHRSTTPVSYEDVDFPDWEESDNEASVSSASKKKVGRPRKSDAHEIKQAKDDSNIPRGRGRPKKTEQPKGDTNGTSSDRTKQKAADLPRTSAKKKRGRPKKVMSAAGDRSDISDDDDSAERPQGRRRERSQDERGESSKENTSKNSRNIRKRLVLVGHSDAYSDSSYSPSEEDDDDYVAGGKKRKVKEAGSDEDFKPYKMYYNKKKLAQAKQDSDPNAPKKGRGRPRTTPKPSGDETPKPKTSSKGRGRPRKTPKPDKEVVQKPKTPSRGRGRPPKIKRPVNDSAAKEDAAPCEEDAEVQEGQSKEPDAVCAAT